MRIDTSIPIYSKNYLFLDVPYRYALRHFLFALHPALPHSLSEKISHFALGLLDSIPVLGLFFASGEYLYHSNQTVVFVSGETPYERGLCLGLQLRSRIQNLYSVILKTLPTEDLEFKTKRNQLISHIPKDTYRQLQGLAKGAKVSLSDVLNIHLFLDISTSFACSVAAIKEEDRAIGTNHFEKDRESEPCSVSRAELLQKLPLSSFSEKQQALQAVAEPNTIQSIFFNPSEGTIYLASSWGFASNCHFVKHQVFPPNPNLPSSAALIRNLDWPEFILGSETIIVVYDSPYVGKVASVTFPGFIGALSGMNQQGLALACSTTNSNKDIGMPITFLFSQVLEKTKSVEEATALIEQVKPASSMNLTLLGPDAVKKIEVSPLQKTYPIPNPKLIPLALRPVRSTCGPLAMDGLPKERKE